MHLQLSDYWRLIFERGCVCEREGIPWWPGGKEPPANAGNVSSVPGSRISPGGGNGNLFQYSCLENSMDRGAWWAIVSGVAKIWT